MRMFKKEEGFTLVELMVVVLIIGILVAIAIPVFNAAQDSAKKSACQNNLRVLDGAVQQWVAANPANLASAITDLGKAEAAIAAATPAADGTTGNYVKDWDKSTLCPSKPTVEGAYGVVTGDFYCKVDAGHNYDGQGTDGIFP